MTGVRKAQGHRVGEPSVLLFRTSGGVVGRLVQTDASVLKIEQRCALTLSLMVSNFF